nr:zinc finger, CCHC-type [Tanacetum cinerariifolium]
MITTLKSYLTTLQRLDENLFVDSKPSHEGYRNTIELPKGNNVVPLRLDTIRLMQNGCSFYQLWSEDPDQHLKDFLKLVDSLDHNVKEISLPQNVLSTFDRRLIELENEVQRLMEAHLAHKKPIQVNKITSSSEICNGPHDTQYCMENPKQAFVYASSRNNEVGGYSMDHVNIASTDQIQKEELQSKGIKSPSKLLFPKYLSQAEEENVKPNATKYNDHEMTAKVEENVKEESEDEFEEKIKEKEEEGEEDVEYFDTFPTLDKLGY